ncbi:Cysteine-rich secretory protein [Zostera marina]|uniref:Cysteine-rich secretory protein n=1 Tax=Zostera marina TaxID=29655 RepID=A0A0K9NZS8_ZOSMR|nr:Cysteine-rich secretory protein [Zostera marina]
MVVLARDDTSGSAWDFLVPHNVARAQLGIPPLIWDLSLVGYAQWYAHVRKEDCLLEHSNYRSVHFGENVFQGDRGYAWTAEDAVNDWINEVRFYNYFSNTCIDGKDCGHYTQVMWRQTMRVGCARVECYNGGVFITCNYSPPGNIDGQRPY